MELTQEQRNTINHIINNNGLTLVNAIAGSGKTHLLRALSKELPHTNGLYLAYNKSIATEARKAFTKDTQCVTTHSLAYQAVVKPNKFKVGFFNYRNITEKLPYEFKCGIVDYLREFCLSKYTEVEDFVDNHKENLKPYSKYLAKYLNKMSNGKIDVTHDFYLKLFHIQLAEQEITYDPFDFVLLDEAGDVNPVTAEIFMLLPTNKRVAVGDPHQNIYSFNHTINCFETLADKGTTMALSQSFRVPDNIAIQVERFCRDYLHEDMVFKGVKVTDRTINTRAYITRTNSVLVAKMIDLIEDNVPFGLVRKASSIFEVPLIICNLKYKGIIKNPQYKHLQEDYDAWHDDPAINSRFKSALAYVKHVHDDDLPIRIAIQLVIVFGKQRVINAYYEARKHESSTQNYVLTTAHSCKGLQFDEVTLGEDMNKSIEDIVNLVNNDPKAVILPEQKEALNLYYVATTRALKRLNNAKHFDKYKEETHSYEKEHYPELLI